jgi:glucose/mannose-6-phosphate isomerase
MGGSASSGDFLKALFDTESSIPLVVNRDYGLPNYVGVGDIVFCASYSGNTEETLSAYAAARKAGARVIAVTSGGKLGELALADGITVYTIPGGQPPRTALGTMLIPMIVACQKLRLIHEQNVMGACDLLDAVCQQLTVEAKGNPAKALAERIHRSLPIIYGLGNWQGMIANRWRCQINENAKQLTFTNAYPELNHNEILGWIEADKLGVTNYIGITLEDGSESEKTKMRSAVTEGLIGSVCRFEHVRAQGDTLLKKMLSLAYFGDFVSLYLARLNGVDPENIDWLVQLKAELAKI